VGWNKQDRYGKIAGKVLFNGVTVDLEQTTVSINGEKPDYEK
jgi:hypothetical protein